MGPCPTSWGLIIGATVTLLVTGCAGPTASPTDVPPCTGDPDVSVSLGAPSGSDGRTAWLTTSGPVHLRATKWGSPHPIFGGGTITAIHVGTEDTGLPQWQPGPGRVTNIQYETVLSDDEVATLDLPDGRYWLVATNYVELEAFACRRDAISESTPAPLPS